MPSFRSFDLHAKLREDARITTNTGGAVSVASCLLILLLSTSEFVTYLTTPPKEVLTVDKDRGQRLPIFFNLTFPHLACSVVSVDTSDVSGEEHTNIVESIYKVPIDHHGNILGQAEVISNMDAAATPVLHPDNIPEHQEVGNETGGMGRKAPSELVVDVNADDYCGNCYGAGQEGECCNTCDDVRQAYRRKGWLFYGGPDIIQCAHENVKEDLKDLDLTGCNVAGHIQVAKVKGKLQFTPARHNLHVHKVLHEEHDHLVNTSHTIHYLRFGTRIKNYREASPLDFHESVIDEPDTTASFRYHVNIVPTSYQKSGGGVTNTNQYAVTQEALYMTGGEFHDVPGVFFHYDISPIRVNVVENPRNLVTFLTNLAAILGGVFTISGIVDSLLFRLR